MKIRFHGTLAALALGAWLLPVKAQAAPTLAQLCESAITLASAKFAQCRLNAESKAAKGSLVGQKFTDALTKCSTKLSDAYSRTVTRFGVDCAVTEPSAAFDVYLTQCSNDTTAAAGGAALPDYAGDLAACNADLGICNGDLATCTADLAARLLKTGQTTSYGAGSDGDLEIGVAQAYADNGDGTITDAKTGLMWEKKSDDGTIHDKDGTYTWGMTSAPYTMNGTVVTIFLATLNAGGGFAGHTDWRLPNLTELESIRNLQNVNPAVSAEFNTNCGANSSGNPGCTVTSCSCTVTNFYWSSSTYAGFPSATWDVDFFDGDTFAGPKIGNYYVRAVRGGS